MAKLFQSEWNEIKARRGVQDLNDLIALLEEDGTIEIADDPSEDEILKAREQAAKDAEAQQKEAEKEQEKADKEAEKEKADAAKRAETSRIAGMSHPDDQPEEALAPEKNVTGAQEGEIPEGKGVGEAKPKATSGASK